MSAYFDLAAEPKSSVVATLKKTTKTAAANTYNSNNNNRNRKLNAKREPLFFFIMRLNLKIVLLFLSIAVLIITFGVYMRCSDFTFPNDLVKHWDRRLNVGDLTNNEISSSNADNGLDSAASASAELRDVECLINQEYTIHCKRNVAASEVYVPFSFLRNYFEVSGSLVTLENQVMKFNWTHSNAKINFPKGKYDARGLFMYFENYNVEVRDRVKCISAAEGVPISTQWEKRGYFYPTQIAQFGLSHYSKNLTEPEPRIRIIEDADDNHADWNTPKSSNLTRIWHPKFGSNVVQFDTAIDFESAISMQADHTLDLVLSIDLLLVTNSSSLMITLQNRETKQSYNVYYILADLVISVQEHNIYYGLGSSAINKWRHLTRDLLIDVQKGIAASGDRKSTSSAVKMRRSELKVVAISFLGIGFFDNITLSTYDHLAHFYDAAEWFVNQQDAKTGGWPNSVKRNLNGFAELKSGWLSAMGQGHAISLLARAYWHSGGDKRFLHAAALGLRPFRVLSKDGGVLAQFMDKYNWYEEYPTTPASFVLNGFIYSLLGLYDINSTAPAAIAREAGKLFNQGMHSLKKMLLLYDTGSGTSYDLRHLSLGVAPNLARWDYHATHVNQLLLLATIDSDPLIAQTAERWKGYMFGKRAKHN